MESIITNEVDTSIKVYLLTCVEFCQLSCNYMQPQQEPQEPQPRAQREGRRAQQNRGAPDGSST